MKYSMPRRCKKTPTLHIPNATATTFTEKVAMFRETLFHTPLEIHLTEAEAPSRRLLP